MTLSFIYATKGHLYPHIPTQVVRPRFQVRNPIPLKIRRVCGLVYVKPKRRKRKVRKLEKEVPAQVSTSSLDRDSELRDPTQNIPLLLQSEELM
ncbi:hypothetical protein AVEN_275243-1 [Araneus ventricosus]|uniref:Uncharacterized protein n=1 Tax=Araneus ventricosus TaxID=182803 RepID=A0A4Y2JKS1_ARAVE|nr:hypothetical protein AVEN_275243-1 [Araneus ventricosus]